MQNKALSLFDLLNQVKLALKNALPFSWWVMAEISELKVNYSGHCYLELIEKDNTEDSIKARARATIWASVFRMLQPYFETTTHTKLTAGIKVLVKVSAEFHELYGFSLNITDIEPSYTVGELTRKKQEIINRLKTEGVFDMNKELPFPELPRRIAVISSKTAAGYGDFMNQLTQNPFGYKFYVRLFPAVMQGEEAEQSIIHSLDRIFSYDDFFDLVAIIRGGGAQSDLNCFNSYLLTSHICQFPLPVITGIGHEQDETITDLVAYTRLKTPTAVAEFLINLFSQADEKINNLSVSLFEIVSSKVKEETGKLDRYSILLKPAAKKQLLSFNTNLRLHGASLNGDVKRFLLKESGIMNRRIDRVKNLTMEYIHSSQHNIDMLFRKNTYLDPFLILSRGYSVTYYKGKALKNPTLVADNEIIETRLAEGTIKSKKLKK